MSLLPLSCTLLLFSCGRANHSGIDPLMAQYTMGVAVLQQEVRDGSASGALATFRMMMDRNPRLAALCHGMAHEIGHAAYAKYGFTGALRYDDDICGSGYVHGVVEEYLADIPDIGTSLLHICPDTATTCFHGLGHGLMLRSSNDVPGSLELCARFAKSFQRIQCAEGVFMENFDTDPTAHPSRYLRPDDPYFACRGQTTVNEGVCALYAPRYYVKQHPGDYPGALRWCQSVPPAPRDACYKGVGAVMMKQTIDAPLQVEELCGRAPASQQEHCIEGMVSYYIVHFASSRKGEELCGILQQAHQPTCRRIVAESREFYPR